MVYKFVARFGERASSSFRRFGGSEFESRRSPFFKLCTCFFLFRFLIISSLWLVSLYSHCWSLRASRGFCDNVFLVYQLLPGHDRTWKVVRITDHFCKLALNFFTIDHLLRLPSFFMQNFHSKTSWNYCVLSDQPCTVPLTIKGHSKNKIYHYYKSPKNLLEITSALLLLQIATAFLLQSITKFLQIATGITD